VPGAERGPLVARLSPVGVAAVEEDALEQERAVLLAQAVGLEAAAAGWPSPPRSTLRRRNRSSTNAGAEVAELGGSIEPKALVGARAASWRAWEAAWTISGPLPSSGWANGMMVSVRPG
jgi:hypothetical protein